MAKRKSSASQKSASAVMPKARTGKFVPVKEAGRRSATQREKTPLPGFGDTRRYEFKQGIVRDAKTGSFTTSRSTMAIRADVDRFTPALERLAKK